MRTMTPTGRQQTDWGNPPGRPAGPTQHLIPVGPPASYAGVPIGQDEPAVPIVSPRTLTRGVGVKPLAAVPAANNPNTAASAHQSLVGLPKINSPLTNINGTPSIPWTQYLVSLWRLAQPTGISPGTFAGITFNVYGQAINAVSSGFTLDSPQLTGNPTAPTPPVGDNSTAIATTAWVHLQGYITSVSLSGDVSSPGGSALTTTVTGIQGRPVSGAAPAVGDALVWNGQQWAPGQAGIPDAPADGQLYARQNHAWVRLSQAIIPPV